MKTFKVFMEGAKTCPPGEYRCFDDKKCKKIPRGYHVGYRGHLEPDNEDGKKNGNGNGSHNGNGNGNGHSGNGNGGNGNGGGGNGGGGE